MCIQQAQRSCRSEWTNLFEFIQAKQLRIENFKEVQQGPGVAATPYLDDDLDAGKSWYSRLKVSALHKKRGLPSVVCVTVPSQDCNAGVNILKVLC